MKPAILISAVLIGAFRPVLMFREFNPHIESGYQAVAHILVGALLAMWFTTKQRWTINTFWILTAIEVVCAGITIYRKVSA